MMTTRREDGHLESRPMATQKRATGADLWFVAAEGAGKLADIERDPHVNLAYYKDRTREWISVSGLATLSRDREKIRELFAPDWKIWFGEEGDPRHGTADDPRLVLIGVEIHAASFLDISSRSCSCSSRSRRASSQDNGRRSERLNASTGRRSRPFPSGSCRQSCCWVGVLSRESRLSGGFLNGERRTRTRDLRRNRPVMALSG